MRSYDISHALFMLSRGENLYQDYVIVGKKRLVEAAQEINRLNKLARELAFDLVNHNNTLKHKKQKQLSEELVTAAEKVLEAL